MSVTREQLKLESLEEKRKNHRLCLLTRILQAEEQHNTLLQDYEEAMGKRQHDTMTTRAATTAEPKSISISKIAYHTSFLPETIRDLRGEQH